MGPLFQDERIHDDLPPKKLLEVLFPTRSLFTGFPCAPRERIKQHVHNYFPRELNCLTQPLSCGRRLDLTPLHLEKETFNK